MYVSLLIAFLVPAYAGASVAKTVPLKSNPSSASGIQYAKGMVSANFHNVPLRLAMQQISAATGLVFHIDKAVHGAVNFKTKRMALDRAMYRIFRPYNNAFVFDDVNGVPGLREVKIFRRGVAGRVLAASTDVIKSGKMNGLAVAGFQYALSMRGGKHAVNASTLSSARRAFTVNPRSVAGLSRLMRAISQTEHSIVMIHHKMQGEVRAIKTEQVKLQEKMNQPGLQGKQEIIKQMNRLNAQVTRARQNNVQMLMNEQKNLKELLAMRKAYANPDRQKQLVLARQSRQVSISRARQQQSLKWRNRALAKTGWQH